MCFGGNRSASEADKTSKELLAREKKRQADVLAGKAKIDSAFTQFNDPYYASYKEAYKGNYIPQVDDQYKSAVAKTLAALAGRGIDRSSIGAAKQGELAGKYLDAKTTVSGEADEAANDLRSKVENARSNLYSLNNASADPAQANTAALGQAKTLVAPPTFSPIGDIFASFVEPIRAGVNASNNTPTRTYSSPFSTKRTGYGSGKVVG